jgi:hypothetical protein
MVKFLNSQNKNMSTYVRGLMFALVALTVVTLPQISSAINVCGGGGISANSNGNVGLGGSLGLSSGGGCGAFGAFGGWGMGGASGPFGLPAGSILGIVATVVNWLLVLLGILGILGFIISGIMYLLSAGDEDMAKRAKRGLLYSIIGIIVGLSGFVIMQAIDGLLRGMGNV